MVDTPRITLPALGMLWKNYASLIFFVDIPIEIETNECPGLVGFHPVACPSGYHRGNRHTYVTSPIFLSGKVTVHLFSHVQELC